MAPIAIPETLNLTSFFLDHNLTEGRGQNVALRADGVSITYAQVAAQANRVAHLLGTLGCEVEDRVLLMLPDVPAFAYAWFGLVKRGCVACAVSQEQTADEARYFLEYTRAKVVFTIAKTAAVIESIRPTLKHLRHVVVVDSPAFEAALAAQPDAFDPYPTHRDDPAVWLFTSGSTGFPKAAVHRARDFAYNTLTYALPIVGYREGDVVLSVPRLAFGYALGSNLLFPFRAGATAVLFDNKPRPELLCALAESEKATVFITVPTSLNALANFEGLQKEAWAQTRVCVCAGEALPEELYTKWKSRTGVEVLDGIGSAEMFHIFVTNRLGDVVLGSLGREVEGYEARVCDDDGRPVPDGDIGTLWVRGGSIAIEYWHNRDLSLQTFRGEWCVSQDKFTRDAKGYFRFCGRGDDMLKVGGKWLSPLEVENALLAHPTVKEAAVIGFKDADGLDKPRAFVVLQAGEKPDTALAEALKAHVRLQLEPNKAPRDIRFVSDLPKSERGKVLKSQLR
jgi:benzoate-CoA ligase family protein